MATKLPMAKASLRHVLPRISEKVEQSHVVQLLRSFGCTPFIFGTRRRRGDYQGTMQSPGIADVLAFLPERIGRVETTLPRLVFVECKAEGGRLRPEQRVFRELCLAAGVPHIVGGLDAVIAWFIERGYAQPEQFSHYRQPKG